MVTHLNVAAEPAYFRGASVRSRLLGMSLKHTIRPLLDLWAHLPFDLFPPNVLELATARIPIPDGTICRTVPIADFTCEWVQAAGVRSFDENNPRAILYFHGGAFVTCGINTHRRLVSSISAQTAQPVLNVGYRQMPHQPITESIADGVAAFRALIEQGYRAENITLMGDSAGGYLAFSVSRAVIDTGLGRPSAIVALSPLLDMDWARKAAHRNANRCQTFSLRTLERFSEVSSRLDTRRGISGARTCPVDMDLTDLPPVLIQIGSREILMADAEFMANRLLRAGVPCQLQIWDRQVHVFHAAEGLIPEAAMAIGEIGIYLDQVHAEAGRFRRVASRTRRPNRAANPSARARANLEASVAVEASVSS